MTSLDDLYVYYCRRCACKANSKLRRDLQAAYEAVGHERVLREISLADNYVGPRGFQPVVLLLANLHSVEVLDARHNMLTHDSIEALADAVSRHKGIREIRLDHNAFNDASANLLLLILRKNWRITELTTLGNDFAPTSLDRIEAQLTANRKAVQEALESESMLTQDQKAVLLEREIARYTPWTSSVDVSVPSHKSGGSLQFASWRDGPQLQLYTSHKAQVTITLTVDDPSPTRLIGFAVLKGDSMLRAIDIGHTPVLAESSFSDVCATINVTLDACPRTACKPYIIVPFSFAPGKAFQCKVSATMPSDIDSALIKVEPMDTRYDWYFNRLDGSWADTRAGGAMSFPTWRESDMYRIRYSGPPSVGTATIHFILTKANDEDDNDDRAIGLYLLRPDMKQRRPVRRTADGIISAADHKRQTTITHRVQMPCDSTLDVFLLPSTLEPFQTGSYICQIFSTCRLEVELSPYSSDWAIQTARGEWDHARSGGCRADNVTTWIHNPSYRVVISDAGPVDLHVAAVTRITTRRDQGSTSTTSSRRGDGVAFDDASVVLVRTDASLTPVAQAPWCPSSAGPVDLWVNDLPPGEYFMIPLTRLAGHLGDYALTISTSRTIFVDSEVALATRLRQRQLEKYDEENATRAAQDSQALSKASPHHVAVTARQADLPRDASASAALREAAIQAYHQTGNLFVDRDFPRGPSSVYHNAVERPYSGDHPAVASWKRPAEMWSQVLPLRNANAGALPQGYRTDWVHSALAVVMCRPDLASRLIATDLPKYGLFQFCFFKSGEWQTVTIDDYLPVDAADALCFSTGLTEGDVLASLVEKAYAKLHRSYEALDAHSKALTVEECKSPQDLTSDSCDVGYSLVSRALQDFTGGVCLERRMYDADGKAWVMKGLWSHLQTARSPDRIIAVRLTQSTPRYAEKKDSGIYVDRLYPVLDARDVEGVKLVKLRNFWGWGLQDSGASKSWIGKWRSGAATWTTEIAKAVAFDPSDNGTFWVSAEELAYYFGVVHTVELSNKSCWESGVFAANAEGGDLLSGTWQHNPQYALRVDSTEPTRVIVGIHQPDALLHLTRDDTARVDYQVALGGAVIRTVDDQRKLQAITDTEVPFNGPAPRRARDAFFAVNYDPRHKYIVVPFNATPALNAPYYLSVWCERPVTLSKISGDRNITIDGEWTHGSAGGPTTCGTWRDNPQYVLTAAEPTTVTVILRQRNQMHSTTDHIGFTVLEARSARRVMKTDEAVVVADVKHQNTHAVQCNVTLKSASERLGMPYIIVPSLSLPNVATGFTLEVVSNARVSIRPLDAALDFSRKTITSQIDYATGNSGGDLTFSSWRCNPQYAVTFPFAKSGTMIVSVTKRTPGDEQPFGVAALETDDWDHGRRRKVSLAKNDILAQSPNAACGTFTEMTVTFDACRKPIIIMPYASRPFSTMDFDLTIYCTCDFDIRPVDEWISTDVSGSWELGLTAGGSREKHARTWVNNPFFALSVTKPTRVLLVGLQYPRGPEKPVIRRVGANRVLVPPPIVNEKTKVCFGLDVCTRDAGATVFATKTSTKHTFDGEICATLTLEACATEPYYIVPHTYDAEEEADFRVVAYSDQPIQFYPFAKERKAF